MSHSLARRRHTGLGNPIGSDDISRGVGWLGIGALVGAGLGAALTTPRTTGALNGGASGIAITSLGGLVVAAFSPASRGAGIAAAGIGLGSLAAIGITMSLVSSAQA